MTPAVDRIFVTTNAILLDKFGFEEILTLRAPMNRGGKRRRRDEEIVMTLRNWESSEAIRRAPSLKPTDEDMVQLHSDM